MAFDRYSRSAFSVTQGFAHCIFFVTPQAAVFEY